MAEVFAIGYNVKQANELMDNVAAAYKNLGIYTKDQWNGVVNALQTNWVGEDEQDFEKKLAERICNLYINSANLTESCVNTIANLAQAWYDFQQNNTINGETAEGKGKFKIDIPTIKKNDKIVEAKLKSIGNDESRGLRHTSSKTTIKSAVETFVDQIKKQTSTLFEEIKSNNAFWGDQSTKINAYIYKVGDAIAEVTVAIKDMYEALDKLADTSYTTASSDVASQFAQATSDVDTSMNDLGGTRWS